MKHLFPSQRYNYYIERGIDKTMIAMPDPSIMKNVCNMVPSALLTNHDLDPMIQELSEEINQDYEYSVRKCIGKLVIFFLLMSAYSILYFFWKQMYM